MTKYSVCERKRGERDHRMSFSIFLIVPVLSIEMCHPHSGSVFPLSSYFLETSSQTHPEVFSMSQFNGLDNIES